MPKAGQVPGCGLDFGKAARECIQPSGNDRQQMLSRGQKPKDFRKENELKIHLLSLQQRRKRADESARTRQEEELRSRHPFRHFDKTSRMSSSPGSTRLGDNSTSLSSSLAPSISHADHSPVSCPLPSAERRGVCWRDDLTVSPASTRPASSSSRPNTTQDSDLSRAGTNTTGSTCSSTCASALDSPGELFVLNREGSSPGEIMLLRRADDWEAPHAVCTPAEPHSVGPSLHGSRSGVSGCLKKNKDVGLKTNFLRDNNYQIHFTPTGMPFTTCRSPRISKARDPDGDAPRPSSSRPKSASTISSSTPRHKAGEVPRYLADRKREVLQKKEEANLAATPSPVPPGMRVVPEQERAETLRGLKAQMQRCMAEYNRMPLSSHTPSQRQRRVDLEHKMEQTEKMLSLFELKGDKPVMVHQGLRYLPEEGLHSRKLSEAERVKLLQSNPAPM